MTVDVVSMVVLCSLLVGASRDKANMLFWLGFLAYGLSVYFRFGRLLGW